MQVIHQRTKNRPNSTPKLRLNKTRQQTQIKKLSNKTEIKPTFYSVLLDVKGVELASTVDHVTVIEMNAIARLAGLNLLRTNRQISADIIVIEAVGAIFTHLQAILKEISAIKKLRKCWVAKNEPYILWKNFEFLKENLSEKIRFIGFKFLVN